MRPNLREQLFGTETSPTQSEKKDFFEKLRMASNTGAFVESARPIIGSKYDKPLAPGEITSRSDLDIAKNIETLRAKYQPWHHELGNAVAGGIGKGALGALENLGYLIDLKSTMDYNFATEQAQTNTVSDILRKAKQDLESQFPIYKDNPDAWLDGYRVLSDVISTAVEFGIPGGVISKGTKGIIKGLGRVSKYTNFLNTSVEAQRIAQTIPAALATNLMESESMAVNNFESNLKMLEPYIREGMIDRERAMQIANDEAAKIKWANLPMTLQNFFQLKSVIKGTTRGAAKEINKRLSQNILKQVGQFGIHNLTEAGEETYQGIVEREATYRVLKEAGIDPTGIYEGDFNQRVSNYLKDKDLQYEALLGAISGGFQSMSAKAIAGDFYSKKSRTRDEELIGVIRETEDNLRSNLGNVIRNFTDKEFRKNEAIRKGFQAEAELYDDVQSTENAIAAVETGIADGYEAMLQSVVDEGGTAIGETLETKDDSSLREGAQKMIEKLREVENSYIKYSALPNKLRRKVVHQDIVTKDLVEAAKKLDNEIINTSNSILGLKNISEYREYSTNTDNPTVLNSGDAAINKEYKDYIENVGGDLVNNLTTLKADKAALENQISSFRKAISDATKPSAIKAAEQEQKDEIQRMRDKERKIKDEADKRKASEAKSSNLKNDYINRITNINTDEGLDKLKKEVDANPSVSDVDKETLYSGIESKKSELSMPKDKDKTKGLVKQGEVYYGKDPSGKYRIYDRQGNPVEGEVFDTKHEVSKRAQELTDNIRKIPKPIEQDKVIIDTANEQLSDPEYYDTDVNNKVNEYIDGIQDNLESVSVQNTNSVYDQAKVDDEWRLIEGYNVLAWLGREYEGDREDASDELRQGSQRMLMDPNEFLPGTEVTLEVVDDRKDIPDWDVDTPRDSKEYLENVPIIVKDSMGNEVAFLHKVDWITPDKVQADIQADKENLRNLRKQVIDNGTVKTTVKYKGFGKLNKIVGNKSKIVSDAMQDPKLKLAVYNGQKLLQGKATPLRIDGDLVNKKELISGATYAIAKLESGKYMAIPLRNKRIENTQLISLLSEATKLWYKSSVNKLTPEEVELAASIKDITGFDVTYNPLKESAGKSTYEASKGYFDLIEEYINSYNIKDASDLQGAVGGKPSTNGYIRTSNNSIEFMRGGGKLSFITAKSDLKEAQLNALLKTFSDVVSKTFVNTSINKINSSTPYTVFGLEGKDIKSDSYGTYNDYIKQNLETNIFSEELYPNSGIYAYTTQHVIALDTDNLVKGDTKDVEKKSLQFTPEQLSNLPGEIFFGEEIIEDPDGDITIDGDEEVIDFSIPSDITIPEDPYIIQGLTSNQQNSLVNDSVTRYLRSLSNTPERTLKDYFDSRAETWKKVIGVYNNAGNVNKAGFWQTVVDNTDKLYKLTQKRLASLSNQAALATVDSIVDEINEGETPLNERTDFNDDFYLRQDKLTKTSAKFKKFLSTVKRVKKVGDGYVEKELTPGILDVVSMEEVNQTVLQILSGMRPNFDLLVNELEKYRESIDWMPDLIDKLNTADQQVRNQFTTLMKSNYLSMKFIRYRKSDKYNNFQVWDTNANTASLYLREIWKSNVRDTNLVIADEQSETGYILNGEVVEKVLSNYSELNPQSSNEEIRNWVSNFGISLSDNLLQYLRDNKVPIQTSETKSRATTVVWNKQFETGGIFHNLYEKLNQLNIREDSDLNQLFNGGPIKSLASLVTKFDGQMVPGSFNVAGKTYYAYTLDNFMSDRSRDIMGDPSIQEALLNNPYTANSYLLRQIVELEDGKVYPLDSDMTKAFTVSRMSPEAIKEFEKKSGKDDISKFSYVDLNIAQINLFFSDSTKYKDSNKVNILTPPLSDKSGVYIMEVAKYNPVIKEGKLDDATLDELYTQIILPDLSRMAIETPDIKGTDKGKDLFYLFPELNAVNEDDTYKHNIWGKDGKVLQQYKDVTNRESRAIFKGIIQSHLTKEVDNTYESWKKQGIVDEKKKTTLLDNNIAGITNKDGFIQNHKEAIMDYLVNQYIFKSSFYHLYAGDIAQYYKSKADTKIQQVRDTMDNVGKRLAGVNATGMDLADSENNLYDVLVAKDVEIPSYNYEQLKDVLGEDVAEAYSKINSTDAQELTTWRDHLYVLKQQAKISEEDYNKIKSILENEGELSAKELQMVMQPIKPVFFGDVYGDKVLRRLYVKSSSYPLLPQLTATQKIDDLRKWMESYEKKNGRNLRVAFESAVKVGARNTIAKVLNDDGSFNPEADFENSIITGVNRRHFKIQQDVPYDAEKVNISFGTQMSKLVFDTIRFGATEKYGGKTGEAIYQEYLDTIDELFKYNEGELSKELLVDDRLNMGKLQQMLLKEAVERGFSMNEMKGLGLTEDKKDFIVPLYMSPNWNKYQSLLISVVNNNITKMKFPGLSGVLASETGYGIKDIEGEEAINKYKDTIIWVDKPVKNLIGSRYEDGKVKGSQVILPWKFTDNKENRVSINKYVKDGKLDTSKIPKEMLEWIGFRIPTQKHSSMSKLEVVGFLPEIAGDLVIASRDLVAQMGSDFDVDKLYMYRRHFNIAEDGSFEVEAESTKKVLQNKIFNIYNDVLSNKKIWESTVKPLDFGKLPELANEYQQYQDITEFNPLHPDYNLDKYYQATSGKMGVATFALTSVLNAQCQNKTVYVRDPFTGNRFNMRFGNLSTDGLIAPFEVRGDKTRTVSDVISAYLSAAVDNEKERILEKLNINNYSFPVIKSLALMGFDEEVISVFTNQPIVREFVRLQNKYDSFFDETKGNLVDIVYKELKAKDEKGEYRYKDNNSANSKLTIYRQQLASPDEKFQDAVLDRYYKLLKIGNELRKLETILNMDSSGPGKSFAEAKYKQDIIEDLNTQRLVTQLPKDDKGTVDYNKTLGLWELLENSVGGKSIKYGLDMVHGYFDKINPYNKDGFMKVQEEFKNITKSEVITVDQNKKLWNGMRAYNYSSLDSGIISSNNVNNERWRLFIDEYDKKKKVHWSLASIIKDVQDNKNLRNYFINALRPSIQSNGRPSLVAFDADRGEVFDDSLYYQGFYDLVANIRPLGTYNGMEYNTKDLALDLIRYSYLNGFLQESKDYTRYIPIDLLRTIGAMDFVKNMDLNDDATFGITGREDDISKYTQQFFQHNPYLIGTEATENTFSGDSASLVNSKILTYKEGKVPSEIPMMVRLADNKNNQTNIFAWDGKQYNKIPRLGHSFYREYNIDGEAYTVVRGQFFTTISNLKIEGNAVDLLTRVKNSTKDSRVRELSNLLLTDKRLDSVSVEIGNTNSYSNGKITLTKDNLNNSQVILHEALHAIVNNSINNPVTDNEKEAVKKLKSAQEALQKAINKGDYGLSKEDYTSFWNKLKRYREEVSKNGKSNITFSNKEKIAFYGATSLTELVTTAFTQRDTRNLLNEIKVPEVKSKFMQLLEALMDIIRSIFPEVKRGTALNEVMEATMMLIGEDTVIETSEVDFSLPDTPIGEKFTDLYNKLKIEANNLERGIGILKRGISSKRIKAKKITSKEEQLRMQKDIRSSTLKLKKMESRLEEVKKELEDSYKIETLEEVEKFAKVDMDYINTQLEYSDELAFDKEHIDKIADKLEDSDTDRMITTLKFWIKNGEVNTDMSHILMDEYELLTNETMKEKFLSWGEQAKKLDRFLKQVQKRQVEKFVREQFPNLNMATDDIFKFSKDLQYWAANLIDIGETSNVLFQAVHTAGKWSTKETIMEFQNRVIPFEKIYKDAEKVGKARFGKDWISLFKQTYKDGKETGDLTSLVLQDFFVDKSNAKSSIKWRKENEVIFDPNLFFPEIELSSSQIKEKDALEAKLRGLLDTSYEDIYKSATEKIEDYRREREAQRLLVEDMLGEDNASIENLMRDWEKEYSPYNYAKTFVGKGVRYTKTVPSKEEYYDSKFKTIQDILELKSLHNELIRTIMDMKHMVPPQTSRRMQMNTLPVLEQSFFQEFSGKFGKIAGKNLLNYINDGYIKSTREVGLERGVKSLRDVEGEADRRVKYNVQFTKDLALKQLEFESIKYENEFGNPPSSEWEQERLKELRDSISREKSWDLLHTMKYFMMQSIAYKHKAALEDSMKAVHNIVKEAKGEKRNRGGITLKKRSNETYETSLNRMQDAFESYYTKFLGEPFKQPEGVQADKQLNKDEFKEYTDLQGKLTKKEGLTPEEESRKQELLDKMYKSRKLTSEEKELKAELLEELAKVEENLRKGVIDTQRYAELRTSLEERLSYLGGKFSMSKLGDGLLKYYQLKVMGWNFRAGVANIGFGLLSNYIQGADGRNYSISSLNRAYGILMKTLGRGFNNPLKRKVSMMMKKLDVEHDSSNELFFNRLNTPTTEKMRKLAPYQITKATEFWNQGAVAIAVLMETRHEGKRLWDLLNEDGEFIVDLPESVIKEASIKIDAVNKINHGNYDPQDSPIKAKEVWLWRAALQFKTWAISGFQNRFMKEHFDERLGITRKGRYRSLFAKPEGMTVGGVLAADLKYFARKLTLGQAFKGFSFESEGFTEEDAANMRANITETSIYLGMLAFGHILMALTGDDDEQKTAKLAANFAMNMLSRVESDVLYYLSPIEIEKLHKNPIAAASLLEDLGDLIISFEKLLAGEDELQSGPDKGKSRIARSIIEFIPGASQVQKTIRSAKTRFE